MTETVRVDSIGAMAAAVPYLLGFQPTESLVAIALTGPRDRMAFSMRVDLPPTDTTDYGPWARLVTQHMAKAGADAVLLAIYTEHDYRPLVDAITATLPLTVREAMRIHDGRVWSLLCDDTRCCPPEGHEIVTPSHLAAAHIGAGARPVQQDRDALVALAQTTNEAAILYEARLMPKPDVFAVQAMAETYDPRLPLTAKDAAVVLHTLDDITMRDELVAHLVTGDEGLAAVMRDVARRTPSGIDAAVCTMAAVVEYMDGNGVVAEAFLDRALASDADYGLAQLLHTAIRNAIPPTLVREALAKAAS